MSREKRKHRGEDGAPEQTYSQTLGEAALALAEKGRIHREESQRGAKPSAEKEADTDGRPVFVGVAVPRYYRQKCRASQPAFQKRYAASLKPKKRSLLSRFVSLFGSSVEQTGEEAVAQKSTDKRRRVSFGSELVIKDFDLEEPLTTSTEQDSTATPSQ